MSTRDRNELDPNYIRYPGQLTGENPFRCCLWCNKEISPDRRDDANFCRFDEEGNKAKCADKFKTGISQQRYWELTQQNLKKHIRDKIALPSPIERRARRRTDSLFHRICKLGEFKDAEGNPLCNEKFSTYDEGQLYCRKEGERCRIRANSIRARERRHKRQAEKAIALKKGLEAIKTNN